MLALTPYPLPIISDHSPLCKVLEESQVSLASLISILVYLQLNLRNQTRVLHND